MPPRQQWTISSGTGSEGIQMVRIASRPLARLTLLSSGCAVLRPAGSLVSSLMLSAIVV